MPATEIRITGFARCSRAALMGGTALRAAALVVLSSPALAQIAPGAHPVGGVVVGGQAGIAQAGNNTVITQGSQRAAINWQGFDVGAQASVTFRQPGSSAIALNRVIGPNPSEIAGRITANGQVVIVNQSGVVFDQGAQVDTAGLVVSAADITNQNFLSGHLVFDRAPRPGARIANNGTLTIRQAGLAALVAPTVSNTGLIRAQLGRVVLAGAATYTLDLYGDGLLSLNVTGQVTSATLGGRTVPALVTNSGLILADGGTVLLTAQAADGLIRTLVEAGGTIQSHSLGARTGRVLAQGIGGSVAIEGTVDARGIAPGTTGGQVVADATGDVTLARSAVVDTSGDAGGGLVALGTNAARAAGGPRVRSTLTARNVTVAAGARVAADALTRGHGGKITLLSAGLTSTAGAITVLGGARGGDGGAAEVSGATIALLTPVDARAPLGRIGSLLLDPTDLYIADTAPTAGTLAGSSYLNTGTLQMQLASASVSMSATNDIDFAFHSSTGTGVFNTLKTGTNALTLTAGQALNIDNGFSITGTGAVVLTAGTALSFDTTTGTSLGLGTASSASAILNEGAVTLQAGTDLALAGAGITGTSIALTATSGGITGTGVLTSPTLAAAADTGITLSGNNDLNALGAVSTTTGGIQLVDQQMLTTNGAITASAGTISLATLGLDIRNSITSTVSVALSAGEGDITEGAAGLIHTPVLSASATKGGSTLTGMVDLSGANLIGTVVQATADGDITINNAQSLTVAGLTTHSGNATLSSTGLTLTGNVLAGGTVTLTDTTGDVIESGTGLINAGSLNGSVTAGKATLGGANLVGTVAQFTTHGNLVLDDSQTLGVGDLTSSSGNVTLSATSLGLTGTVLASTGLVSLTSTGGGITESGAGLIHATSLTGSASGGGPTPAAADLRGNNLVGTLSAFATDGDFQLADNQALIVKGALNGAGALVSLKASGITVASATGTVHGGGLVTLRADGFDLAGAVTTPLAGAVAIDVLTAGGTLAVGGAADSFGGNGVANVSTGTLALGSLDGSTGSGDVAGITVTGALDLTGVAKTLGLFTTAAGNVSVPGVLTVGTVFGSSGDFSLAGANAIGTLGTIGATTLAVSDTGDLTVSGTVQGTQTATIATTGTLTVSGSVTGSATALSGSDLVIPGAATGSTSLTLSASTGTISEAGSLDTALLTGSANGSAALTGSNTITALGGLSADGLTLLDTPDLAVSGSVQGRSGVSITDTGTLTVDTGGSIAGSATSLTAAAIGIPGSVTAPTSLSLTATSGTIAVAGGISTGLLTGQAGTSVRIGGTSSVTDLGTFTASGFSLTQTDALDVTGAVTGGTLASIGSGGLLTVGGSVSGSATSLSGTRLAIPGAATGSNTLTLTATTGTIGAAGSLSTALLTGSAVGSATLDGSNAITGLGSFSAAGLTLHDTPDLQVTGTVDAGSALTLVDTGTLTVAGSLAGSATALTAAALDMTGSVAAPTSLSLTSISGGISAAGSLSTGTLSVSAAMGTVSLTGASANSISTLTASSAGQNFTLDDGVALKVTGSVSAGTDGAAATLKLTAPTLTLLSSGSLTSTGTVALGSDSLVLHGPVTTPTSGVIALDELTGHTLSIQASRLGTLTTGELALGSLDGTTASGQVTDVTLMGDLDLSTHAGTLALFTTPTGTVTSTGGVIAGTLTGSAGTVTLTGADNDISHIGDFSAASLVFSQSGALDVSGMVNAGALATLTSGGLLKVDGSVTASATSLTGSSVMLPGNITGSTNLTLTASTGDITEAGSITTALLTGSAVGSAALTGSNDITNLGGFTASGFTLIDTPGLHVTGSVMGGDAVTIADTGTLSVAASGSVVGSATILSGAAIDVLGGVAAPMSLSLTATNGAIADTGSLSTGLLTGSATGSAGFSGTTDVTNLGTFTASGFSLSQAGSLDVTGVVGGGTLASISSGAELTIDGSVTASNTALGGTALSIPGTATGSATLTLTATSAAIDAAGSLDTALLTGSATGSAALSGSNSITALGSFSAARLMLSDAPDLQVTGSVSGGHTLSITDAGTLTVAATGSLAGSVTSLISSDIDIDGSVTAPTSLSLTSTVGSIAATGGISTGTLTGSAATTAIFDGTTNSIGTLGVFTAQALHLSQTGGLDETGIVTGGTLAVLDVGGALAIDGSVTADATSLRGSSVDIAGSATGSTALTLTATSGTIAAPGTLTTALLTGSATGSAVLAGTNHIDDLGSFIASGLMLTDTPDLTISGGVTGTSAVSITDAGTLTIGAAGSLFGSVTQLTAAAIGIGGTLSAPTSLSLTSTTGSIAETGSLSTGLLTGNAATTAGFSGIGSVTRLGDFTANGFAFTQGGALDVTGAVDGGTLAMITSTGGLLTVGGSVTGVHTALSGTKLGITGTATGSTALTLTATSGTIAASGALSTAKLTGSATGSATLDGANSITTLGSFNASGFSLTDAPDLMVTGHVTGAGNVAITDSGVLTIASEGSVSGSVTALTAASLVIPGSVTASTSLSLTSSTVGIAETGTLSTALLTGSAARGASFTGTDSITDLGSFSSHGFTLTQTGALTVIGAVSGGTLASIASGGLLAVHGSVSAGTTSLTGANVDIPGTVVGSTRLTLTANSGTIAESGHLTTAMLTGSATGRATLTGGNSITTIGSFAASGFSLTDTPDLMVVGAVNGHSAASITDAGTLTIAGAGSVNGGVTGLTAAAIAIDGAVVAPTSLSLTSTVGAIDETGSITTGLLTGSATTTASLTGNNDITDLGAFSVGGGFTYSQAGALDVTGAIAGGPLASITSGGLLTIAGGVTAEATMLTGANLTIPGTATGSVTLALTARTGSITETGTLTTALLTGSAVGSASLTGSNAVTSLGAFTANGLTLTDAPDLLVTGSVNGTSAVALTDAGTLTIAASGSVNGLVDGLTAAAIVIDGAVTAPTSLSLTSTVGAIAETGSLATGLLTGGAATTAGFSGNDRITDLGNFSAQGFDLAQAGNLDVTGAVSGGTLAMIASGGLLTVDGNVTAVAAALTGANLAVPGAATGSTTLTLTATAGTISATGELATALLTGSATASATLVGSNAVGALGGFTADGLTLMDAPDLQVVGTVNGNSAISIADAGTLTVAAAGSLFGSVTGITSAAIVIDGAVGAPTSLSLTSTVGAIAETGSLTTGLLTGRAATSASFSGSDDIAVLGDFTADGFALAQAPDLDVTGAVSGGTSVSILLGGSLTVDGSVTAGATALQAGSLAIPGAATGSSSLTLTADAGGITETGALDTALLTGSAVGSASLTGTNEITVIGDFASSGLTVVDLPDLLVAGSVNGGSATAITDAGVLTIGAGGSLAGFATTLSAAAIGIDGSVEAPGMLSLSATGGNIAETGTVSAGTLTGSATGAASLVGSNSIATLGDFSATSLTLDDTPDLTVAGAAVQAATSLTILDAGRLTVAGGITAPLTTLTASSIDLPGAVAASGMLVLGATAGAITETGVVDTAVLTGGATGSVSLDGSNAIATLGDFSAAGFALNDTQALTVAGVLTGGATASIADTGALTVAGRINADATALTASSIDLSGAIAAPLQLSLTATAGDIIQSGSIATGLLTGSATGNASLTGAVTEQVAVSGLSSGVTFQNDIGTLGAFTANGFVLDDQSALVVTGPLQGGASTAIDSMGAVTIPGSISGIATTIAGASIAETGSITASASLTLSTPGSIAQSGVLITAFLTGGSGGSASFIGTDQVATLGDFTAFGFALNDGNSLAISGHLKGGPSVAIDDVDGVSVPGTIQGDTTALTAATIDIPGGITASALTLTALGGAITAGGSITAGELLGSAGGGAGFTGSTNSVGTLGAFTSAGFVLDDQVALSVTGAVQGGPSVQITSLGTLDVLAAVTGDATALRATSLAIGTLGSVTSATSLSLDATGGSISAPGVVTTPLLTASTTGSLTLSGANHVAELASATTPAGFTMIDADALKVSGTLSALAGSVDLTTAGLDVAGRISAANTVTLGTAGTITLTGNLTAPTILAGTATDTPLLVEWNGGSVLTGSTFSTTVVKPVFPKVDGSAPGIYVLAHDFTQTGTTQISGMSHVATVDISLSAPKGHVAFDPSLSAGLIAPTTQLFLDLNAGGTVSGHIVVAGLNVSYVEPAAPSLSDISGTIGGLGGQSAAGRAYILPLANANYRLNSCAIQSVNCVLLSPVVVPIYNPTEDVSVETPHRRREDDDLIIPNVGDEDF